METPIAVAALAALAHTTRLDAFRLLIRSGPEGIAAGEIAAGLGVPAPTLSFHLKELVHAGLVHSWREHRFIRYAADYDMMRQLMTFLSEDCCDGRPEICGELFVSPLKCSS